MLRALAQWFGSTTDISMYDITSQFLFNNSTYGQLYHIDANISLPLVTNLRSLLATKNWGAPAYDDNDVFVYTVEGIAYNNIITIRLAMRPITNSYNLYGTLSIFALGY